MTESTAYQEKWYTYWGLGSSTIQYADKTAQDFYDLLEESSNQRMTIAMDLLGIYIPVGEKTIGGVVINAVGDRFDFDNDWFQENYYTYSLSAIHYFKTFGKGFFLRADGGIATYNYQDSYGINQNGNKSGYGILAGGGYSFSFGGTRLLLNLNASYRNINEIKMNYKSVSLGGLF